MRCDKNGDKSLDAGEVQELLSTQGYDISLRDTAELVAMFDTNGDGRLQYFEVLQMLSHANPSANYKHSPNPNPNPNLTLTPTPTPT